MNLTHPEELAKLHCLKALFRSTTGQDPVLAGYLKAAIDFSVTGDSALPAPILQFTAAALDLAEKQDPDSDCSYGLEHIELRGRTWDPLWMREELIGALKRLAGYEHCLLLVTGLREGVCPQGRPFTSRRKQSVQDAVAYIDALAARYASASAKLTLLYQ
ncbi:MAG: hypothetical protein SFY80_01355 [Verrucomicrobiota bacterium]|nr:hypothetical protein [Verrucomicrobiota bacterium]